MRLEVPRTYLHLHEQAIKPRKGGSKDRKVDIIIYPHLPGGEEGIEELANSLPHPPAASCLPAGGGLLGSCCPLRPAGCCSPSLAPRDSVELERSGSREPGLGAAGAVRSSGWVGLVWFGESWRERRGEEEIGRVVWRCLDGLAAACRLCHETPTRKDNTRG